MKKSIIFSVFVLCLTSLQAQQFVKYSADSARIKYATFLEEETRDLSPEGFFSRFLPAATINMRNIPAGVYVLHVTDKDGKEYRQKVVRR